MVSNFLGTDPDMCDPVSQFIFQHSKGSPPFIVELLRFANQAGLIVCEQSLKHKTSIWNIDTCSVTSIPQNFNGLSDILVDRLKMETTGVQELLKVAACLGCALDEKLLSIALSAPVSHYVSIAANRKLLIRDESGHNIMFSNSVVQEAAYSLIPVDERQAVHLARGRTIWRGLAENELSHHIPMILYQIKLGIHLVTNPKERYALASLHLQLAERSAKRMMNNEFTFEDFLAQIQQLKKLGGMESMLKFLPGMGEISKQMKNMTPPDDEIKKIEAIIRSMTIQEREDHRILNGSRRQRIASGSGTQPQDINKLVKQFEESKKMMSGMMKMGMGGLMGGGKKPARGGPFGGRGGGKGMKFPF